MKSNSNVRNAQRTKRRRKRISSRPPDCTKVFRRLGLWRTEWTSGPNFSGDVEYKKIMFYVGLDSFKYAPPIAYQKAEDDGILMKEFNTRARGIRSALPALDVISSCVWNVPVVSLPITSLARWSVPPSVIEQYRERGIHELHEWQAKVLESIYDDETKLGQQNIIYTAPTGGGKSLVADIVMVNRLLNPRCTPQLRAEKGGQGIGLNCVVYVVPHISLVAERTRELRELWGTTLGLKIEPFFASVRGERPPVAGDQAVVPLMRWFPAVDVAVMTLEKLNSHMNGWMSSWMIDMDYYQYSGAQPNTDTTPLDRFPQFPIVSIVTDELHILGDPSRGYLLECVMIKVKGLRKKQLESGQLPLQVVALSATIPNIEQVGKWLDASVYSEALRTTAHELDIKLVLDGALYDVTQYKSSDSLEQLLMTEQAKMLPPFPPAIKAQTGFSQTAFFIYNSIRRAFVDGPSGSLDAESNENTLCKRIRGYQVLVFCPTKNWCERMAQSLANALLEFAQKDTPSIRASILQLLARSEPLETASHRCTVAQVIRENAFLEGRTDKMGSESSNSTKLSNCIVNGTAWHHSGLTSQERHAVESNFKSGHLFAIFATNTLAVGVNLPARRVIIRSPVVGTASLDPATFRQMIGRAGRQGTLSDGQKGEVYILGVDETSRIGRTKAKQIQYLEYLLGPVEKIQSCLSDQRLVRLTLELLTIGHLWKSCAHLYRTVYQDSLWGIQQIDGGATIKELQRLVVTRVDRCIKYLRAHNMIRSLNEKWNMYQSAFKSPIVIIRFFIHLLPPPGLTAVKPSSTLNTDPSVIFFPKQYSVFEAAIAPHFRMDGCTIKNTLKMNFDAIVESLDDCVSNNSRVTVTKDVEDCVPSTDPRVMAIRWTSIAYACVEASLHPAKALEITADLLKASLMGVYTARDLHLLFIVQDCSYQLPMKWERLGFLLNDLTGVKNNSGDHYRKQRRVTRPPDNSESDRHILPGINPNELHRLRKRLDSFLVGNGADFTQQNQAKDRSDFITPLLKSLGISSKWTSFIAKSPLLDKIRNWSLMEYHDRLLHGDVELDVLLTLYLVSNHRRFYMAMVLSDYLSTNYSLPVLEAKYQLNANAILALKTNAIHNCGSVAMFAKRIGMSGLSAMIQDVGARLTATLDVSVLPPQSLELLELDLVYGHRALAFVAHGIDTVKRLAESSINDIFTIVYQRADKKADEGELNSPETRKRLWDISCRIQGSARAKVMSDLEMELAAINDTRATDVGSMGRHLSSIEKDEWLMDEEDVNEVEEIMNKENVAPGESQQDTSSDSSSSIYLGDSEGHAVEFDFLRMQRIVDSRAKDLARMSSLIDAGDEDLIE